MIARVIGALRMRTLTCAGGNGHDEAEREESLVCDGNPEVGEEIDGCKKERKSLTAAGGLLCLVDYRMYNWRLYPGFNA